MKRTKPQRWCDMKHLMSSNGRHEQLQDQVYTRAPSSGKTSEERHISVTSVQSLARTIDNRF